MIPSREPWLLLGGEASHNPVSNDSGEPPTGSKGQRMGRIHEGASLVSQVWQFQNKTFRVIRPRGQAATCPLGLQDRALVSSPVCPLRRANRVKQTSVPHLHGGYQNTLHSLNRGVDRQGHSDLPGHQLSRAHPAQLLQAEGKSQCGHSLVALVLSSACRRRPARLAGVIPSP